MALEVALIDSRERVGERRHRGFPAVEPGAMEQHVGGPAMLFAECGKCRGYRFLLGEVDAEEREIRLLTRLVEADDRVGIRQRRCKRAADIAGSSCNEDDWLW